MRRAFTGCHDSRLAGIPPHSGIQLTAHREKRAYLVVYHTSTRFGIDQEASQMGKTSKARNSYSPQGRGTATQQRRISMTWVWIAAAAAGVAILAWLGVSNLRQTADIAGIQYFSGLTAEHTTESVNYAQNPPVGGDHNADVPQLRHLRSAGESENAVHSLEHGAVWVTYQPDLPQSAGRQAEADGPRTQPLAAVPLPKPPGAGGCFGVGNAASAPGSGRSPPGPLPEEV